MKPMNDEAQQILAIGLALFMLCVGVGSCRKMDNGGHFKQPIMTSELIEANKSEKLNGA
jgi:hypothetical protein